MSMANYGMYWVRIVLVGLVLVGGLNWGFHAFGYNLVSGLSKAVGIKTLERVIYTLVAVSAFILLFDRTIWLPFLGESVLPESIVPLKSHDGDTSVEIYVSPNAKVAYWAANPGANPEIDVESAYKGFENSGVVKADVTGRAVLKFNKGTAYVVPTGVHLKSHVHYREVSGVMMGPVQSVFV